MNTLICPLTILAMAVSLAAAPDDTQIRADISEDIPLTEAIQRANTQFPDLQPLTAAEVIAAVKMIKREHPGMSEAIHRIYLRIVEEGVLPRGVYFSRIPVLETETDHFDVDWKDLTLTALPPGTKDPVIGYGFNYRVRARFIASRPLTEQEKADRMKRKGMVERAVPHEPATRVSASNAQDDPKLDSQSAPAPSGGR